jgi:hypothetical protein
LVGILARLRPPSPQRIAATAVRAWPAALAVGLLALLVLPILLVMMAFTIVLIPVVLVVAGITLLVLGLGIASLGQRLTQLASTRLGRPLSPAWAAFVGTLVLILLFQIPVVGQVAFIAVGMLVFGAVLLARFGTRDFHLPAEASRHEDLASYARPSRE